MFNLGDFAFAKIVLFSIDRNVHIFNFFFHPNEFDFELVTDVCGELASTITSPRYINCGLELLSRFGWLQLREVIFKSNISFIFAVSPEGKILTFCPIYVTRCNCSRKTPEFRIGPVYPLNWHTKGFFRLVA